MTAYAPLEAIGCDICGEMVLTEALWTNRSTGNTTCTGCKNHRTGPDESRRRGDCEHVECRARRVPLYPDIWEGTGSITWLCAKCTAGGRFERHDWDVARCMAKKYTLHGFLATTRLADISEAEPRWNDGAAGRPGARAAGSVPIGGAGSGRK